MIDKVCKIIENMVYEFNDLKRKELFNDDEIKSIANKRRQHEYIINSSSSILLNYILYLEYEINLENLREKRKIEKKKQCLDEIKKYKKLIKKHYTEFIALQEKMKNEESTKKGKKLKALINNNENIIKKYKNNILKTEKKLEILLQYSLSDVSMVKRIIKLFQVCLRKHFNNIQIWLQYLNFCYIKQKKEELEKAILNSLKYHMRNELIWTVYLYYFYNVKKNIINTRKLYVRAILFVPHSLYLNILYFNIEFDIFFKLLKNFKEKYKNGDNNLDNFNDFCEKNKNEADKDVYDSKIVDQNNIENNKIKEEEEFLKINSNKSNTNEFSIVLEENKYGLDVIIFLVKRYFKTFQNNKSNLHIFIFLLLNVYLKMEKKKWIRSYILQYEDFKNIIFNSIEKHKMDQPCFYYYLFINKCVKLSNFHFCEDENFLLLKENFYNDSEENYNNDIKKYFNINEVNNLLIELFNSFDKSIMIYFFCLLLTNLFDTYNEFSNISEVFKIDDNKEIPSQKKNEEILSTKNASNENLKNKKNEENYSSHILKNKNNSQNLSENKTILFYMKEPALTCYEELEIFHFLKDEIFLCDTYKFRRINMEYIKEKDIYIYNFLLKLNFTAYICLFENRNSLISKNNFIYDSEQISKNHDVLSSILYFLLFNKKNFKKNTWIKHKSTNEEISLSDSNDNKKRKKTTEFQSDDIEENKRKKINNNKNIYESDSDNMSKSESENESESKSEDESESESESESANESENESESESESENESENESEKEKNNLDQDKINENNTNYSEKNKILKKEIFIIDELLLLLDKEMDLFIKINILRCVLNLIIFLNNKKITDYLKNIITQNYEKLGKSNSNNLLNKEINNLVYLYKRVYNE